MRAEEPGRMMALLVQKASSAGALMKVTSGAELSAVRSPRKMLAEW